MSNPHEKPISGGRPAAQSKTLFVQEGNTTTELVFQRANGRQRSKRMTFPSPITALTWCRTNRARMVYLP